MNIYQELLATKIVEKLCPVSYVSGSELRVSGNASIGQNEQFIESTLASNCFTESFFEKVALIEFEASIYNNLQCSKILFFYYQQIVYTELKQLRNKSNQILVNPMIKQAISENNLQSATDSYKSKPVKNKKLSLTILDFGNLNFFTFKLKKIILINKNLEKAGQSLFYTTHQIFLSSRAVYLICFDLTKDLNDLAHSNVEFGVEVNFSIFFY